MKIAVFHELQRGGARMVVNEMVKRLKKDNQVDLFITSPFYKKEEKQFFTNIKVFKFKERKWDGKDWRSRIYKDSLELIKLYDLHKKIAKEVEEKKYDIFFVHASSYIEAPFVLRFTNIKKIFYCHDPNYRMIYDPIMKIPDHLDLIRKNYERINRIIRKRLDITNIKKADKLIASSFFEKKIIKQTYGLESTVIYYGVDTNFFKQSKREKEFDLLFVGTSHPLEGYPLFLDALKHLPKNLRVKTILGDIEWVSDKKELREYYRKSRVVVCLGRNEPFGLTPLDAMACGVPVVALNEGGYKETVIDGKTGFLAKANGKDIASKINLILKNKKTEKDFGVNGRKVAVEKWSWANNIMFLKKLFKE